MACTMNNTMIAPVNPVSSRVYAIATVLGFDAHWAAKTPVVEFGTKRQRLKESFD